MGLVLPVLLFFVAVEIAYAYFTAVATSKGSAATPVITISFTDASAEINAKPITGSTKLIPGETLSVAGKINNTGTADVYAIITFKIKITKQNGLTENKVSKYYTLNNSDLREIKGTATNYSYYAFELTQGSSTEIFQVEHNFNFNNYNNSYKNAVIEYELAAEAIQKNGIETNISATDILMGEHKSGIKQLIGKSEQNETPTPDSPAEIKSVGDKTKNLLNPNTVELYTNDRLITTSTLKVEKNTDYVISVDSYRISSPKWQIKGWDSEQKNLSLSEAWSGGTHIAGNKETFNSGDYEYITIRTWSTNAEYGIDINTKIQIEVGTTATEYEPYGYRIPITQESENLFDLPSNFEWTGTHTLNVNLPAGTYTLSCSSSTQGSTATPFMYFNNNEQFAHLKNNGFTKKITLNSTETTIYIYSNGYNYNGSLNVASSVKNLRLTRENSNTIYLNEPLRSIGDVYDYLDLENGKVVRKIKEVRLNGTENWTKYTASGTNSYFITNNDFAQGFQMSKCSMFENIDRSWSTHGKNCYSDYSGYSRKYFQTTNSSITTVDEWKNWLSENTPILTYVSVEVRTETITVPDLSWLDVSREFTISSIPQPDIVYSY